jgi:hypothetical protein
MIYLWHTLFMDITDLPLVGLKNKRDVRMMSAIDGKNASACQSAD